MALQIAKKRFGELLHITGDSAFRDMMVKAAVEGKVFVKFSDPTLERRRKEMLYITQKLNQTAKDKEYER